MRSLVSWWQSLRYFVTFLSASAFGQSTGPSSSWIPLMLTFFTMGNRMTALCSIGSLNLHANVHSFDIDVASSEEDSLDRK
jgi:hypothetical protein